MKELLIGLRRTVAVGSPGRLGTPHAARRAGVLELANTGAMHTDDLEEMFSAIITAWRKPLADAGVLAWAADPDTGLAGPARRLERFWNEHVEASG